MSYVSHADLGGQPDHGPIRPDRGGEPWHSAWELRVVALVLAMGATGAWNLDMTRAARETLPDYFNRTYFEIWFGALLKLLDEHGLVSADELAQGRALHPPTPTRVLREPDVATALARGTPTARLAAAGPLFAVGQQARTKLGAVSHHTRLPGYAQGKVGAIERQHGAHVFADVHSIHGDEQPQWLYTVVFDARELWPDAEAGFTVSIDAWEPYLEPA
jgi:nitrile hydratase